jgi:translation initiation factor IF-3
MKKNKFEKKRAHKINEEVKFHEVRVVGEHEPKIMSSREAYNLAQDSDMDLILINENANPPVVRIEDYNKFLYKIQKAEKERKKNSNQSVLKELKLSPEISDHDLNTKAKKGEEFLKEGNRIKCSVQLKGRQKASPERGELIMFKFADILSEFGVPEDLPKLEGGRWNMIIKPKKK